MKSSFKDQCLRLLLFVALLKGTLTTDHRRRMAYPPNDRPDNQLKNYPIMETIPQDKLPRRIVHFDLDPKNSELDLDLLIIRNPYLETWHLRLTLV